MSVGSKVLPGLGFIGFDLLLEICTEGNFVECSPSHGKCKFACSLCFAKFDESQWTLLKSCNHRMIVKHYCCFFASNGLIGPYDEFAEAFLHHPMTVVSDSDRFLNVYYCDLRARNVHKSWHSSWPMSSHCPIHIHHNVVFHGIVDFEFTDHTGNILEKYLLIHCLGQLNLVGRRRWSDGSR